MNFLVVALHILNFPLEWIQWTLVFFLFLFDFSSFVYKLLFDCAHLIELLVEYLIEGAWFISMMLKMPEIVLYKVVHKCLKLVNRDIWISTSIGLSCLLYSQRFVVWFPKMHIILIWLNYLFSLLFAFLFDQIKLYLKFVDTILSFFLYGHFLFQNSDLTRERRIRNNKLLKCSFECRFIKLTGNFYGLKTPTIKIIVTLNKSVSHFLKARYIKFYHFVVLREVNLSFIEGIG